VTIGHRLAVFVFAQLQIPAFSSTCLAISNGSCKPSDALFLFPGVTKFSPDGYQENSTHHPGSSLKTTVMKKYQILGFALSMTISALTIFSCAKNEATEVPNPTDKDAPVIPDGNRIIIHFGTSTYRGCMYSFSNCIWIGWGTELANSNNKPALQFGKGDEAQQYFGKYFPLTGDYVVTKEEAKELGLEAQVIPAGFYVFRDAASGQATGKRQVSFDPESRQPVAALVNPNNPQDNIGQLHNLAVQVVLHENRQALEKSEADSKAVQKLLVEKTAQFLAGAELPVNATDLQRAITIDLNRDFGNYNARLEETRLSANDKRVLREVFDQAAVMPVRSAQELSAFVVQMTAIENEMAAGARMDNPKVVLSMIAVLKYSRYFWYWKSVSSLEPGQSDVQSAGIPEWVWADVIGLELGGPIVSAIASAAVYLDKR